jgi:hypothetical protein
LIVLSADGRKLGKLGYTPGGTKAFLSEMNKTMGKKAASGTSVQARATSSAAAPAPSGPATADAKNAKSTKSAPAPWPPNQTEGLVLKGISGSKEKRMALLNNQTLTTGETASVKVAGGSLRVHCVEVREGSVLLTIDGKEGQYELKLWNGI